MNKTIIAVYGRASEGKSETIKKVCKFILRDFPNAKISEPQDYSGDILVSIKIGQIKIGLESQGDPNSRIINLNTIEQLADIELNPLLGNCDIIVCATRTGGMTVNKVNEVSSKYNYNNIWMSSFYSPTLNSDVLNDRAAINIIEIIKSLIIGQL